MKSKPSAASDDASMNEVQNYFSYHIHLTVEIHFYLRKLQLFCLHGNNVL